MSARKASPGEARARVTRRTVLTVGGLTLIAGYSLGPARSDPAGQGPEAGRTPDARTPGREPKAGASPAGASPSSTRAASARAASTRSASTQSASDSPMFYVDDGPMAIALTIDDGPSPVYTPQVLQLLAKYRVTATFSMIGIEVDAHPGVAREVAAAGHMIANHTWTHVDLASLRPAAVADQMNRATGAIHQATGKVPTLFRAPYGAWSPAVLQQCTKTRMTPLDWSVDPRDWSRPGVAAIVRNIMRNTKTGSIILEHDGGGNRAETVAALKIVLPRLLAAGYHFRIP
jgi:peptidoglycan-N-acetylglucosamine deacetylase